MQNLEGLSGISLQSLSIYLLLLMLATLRVEVSLWPLHFWIQNGAFNGSYCFFCGIRCWLVNQLNFPDLATMMGPNLVPIIFQELFVGLACGLVLSICFASVILAGEKIAATSGLAFAAQIDPVSGAQSPVISQIFQLFLLILFFS